MIKLPYFIRIYIFFYLFYQPIFNCMSSSTSFQLHNYIFFKKFHMDELAPQISQIINLLVSLYGIDHYWVLTFENTIEL